MTDATRCSISRRQAAVTSTIKSSNHFHLSSTFCHGLFCHGLNYKSRNCPSWQSCWFWMLKYPTSMVAKRRRRLSANIGTPFIYRKRPILPRAEITTSYWLNQTLHSTNTGHWSHRLLPPQKANSGVELPDVNTHFSHIWKTFPFVPILQAIT